MSLLVCLLHMSSLSQLEAFNKKFVSDNKTYIMDMKSIDHIVNLSGNDKDYL